MEFDVYEKCNFELKIIDTVQNLCYIYNKIPQIVVGKGTLDNLIGLRLMQDIGWKMPEKMEGVVFETSNYIVLPPKIEHKVIEEKIDYKC